MGPSSLQDLDQEENKDQPDAANDPASHPPVEVPQATLEMLAQENISMKEDLELKCAQILEYKYLVEEYSEKLETQIDQNKMIQRAVDRIKQDNSLLASLSGGPSKKDKM